MKAKQRTKNAEENDACPGLATYHAVWDVRRSKIWLFTHTHTPGINHNITLHSPVSYYTRKKRQRSALNLTRWLDTLCGPIKLLALSQRVPCSRPRQRSTRSESSSDALSELLDPLWEMNRLIRKFHPPHHALYRHRLCRVSWRLQFWSLYELSRCSRRIRRPQQ